MGQIMHARFTAWFLLVLALACISSWATSGDWKPASAQQLAQPVMTYSFNTGGQPAPTSTSNPLPVRVISDHAIPSSVARLIEPQKIYEIRYANPISIPGPNGAVKRDVLLIRPHSATDETGWIEAEYGSKIIDGELDYGSKFVGRFNLAAVYYLSMAK
jgi:hypothetical protein